MSAAASKPPQQLLSLPSWPLCSLQGSLYAVAILAVISLVHLSLSSHRFPILNSGGTPVKLISRINNASVPGAHLEAAEDLSDVFHLPEIFRLNYEAMERDFKVYIYPDGDPETFYQTPRKLTGKYASEGYFFQNIRESRFRTEDPEEADLFFIPISCHKMRGKP